MKSTTYLVPLLILSILFACEINREDELVNIKGIVTDAVTSEPLDHAYIHLAFPSENRPDITVYTQSDGSFQFEAEAVDNFFQVEHDGYMSEWFYSEYGYGDPYSPHDIRMYNLNDAVTINGTLISRQTQAPMKGVIVDCSVFGVEQLTTDNAGQFTLLTKPMEQSLYIYSNAFQNDFQDIHLLPGIAEVIDSSWTVTTKAGFRQGTMMGTVSDGVNPISGARLVSDEDDVAITDSLGQYYMILYNTYRTISVGAEGFQEHQEYVPISEGDTTFTDFVLGP